MAKRTVTRGVSASLPAYMQSNTARARGDRVRNALAVRDNAGNAIRNSRGAIYRSTVTGRTSSAQAGRIATRGRAPKNVGSMGH